MANLPLPSTAPTRATPPASPRTGRPQFNLAGLMIVMLVLSVAAAPAYYLVRAGQGEPGAWLAGILLLLASPMLLIVVLSTALAIMNHWKRK
jgi:hypothetical protein